MIKYIKKYWIWCVITPVIMFGEIAADLMQPKLMAQIVDNGILKKNLPLIYTVGIRMVLLVLFGGFCGMLSAVTIQMASQNFGNDLRKDLFKKIMNLSFEQTDKISTGSLVTRITNDVTQVQQVVNMALRAAIRCTTMFGGGIIMLCSLSLRFGLIVAAGLPFVIAAVIFFMNKATPMFSIVQKRLDTVNNIMQENVAGSRVVKAYVKEDYEVSQFDLANASLCDINLKVQTLLAFMSPCMNIVLNLCTVAIIFVGGMTVKESGGMTPGMIMAAITYIGMILHGVMFMANIFQTFTRAKASANRIMEVLNAEEIIKDGTSEEKQKGKGEIEFRHVSFSYPNVSNGLCLNDINLHIKAGETIGILGATGSGKSTLVKLLPRFYDPVAGEILIDGVNIKNYNLKKLREKISIVMQKTELYSRPIAANIRWGRKDAEREEIKKAAVYAQADDFISASENGYETVVTEGGHSLSGGQKQRISIARALLKKSEILIFDDATSALDLRTEAKLYEALEKEYKNVTKIIIAQRIASVKDADRIAILDHGKLAACDTHEVLLSNCQIYKDIFESQLKKGGEENE